MTILHGVGVAVLAPSIVALKDQPLQAVQSEGKKGTPHVLTIGVSNYPNQRSRLAYAAKDAVDVAAVFQAQQGKLFEKVQCETLTDEKATARKIVKALDGLRSRVGPQDMVVVYLSGHGDSFLGQWFFL